MANTKTETKKMLKNMEERTKMAQDSKFYQYSETIGNTTYTFQYCGKRRAVQIIDESSDEKGTVKKEKLLDNILKTIVVNPSINLDSFDDEECMDDYERVTEIANIIYSGNFRKDTSWQKR